MDFPWAPIISGATSLFGSIFGNRSVGKGQASANAQQMALADKQMEFQERMSSTAHQREVKDLLAAGLNPILSANSGAPMAMGAMPTVQSTKSQWSNMGASSAKSVDSAIAAAGLTAQIAVNSAVAAKETANAREAAARAAVAHVELWRERQIMQREQFNPRLLDAEVFRRHYSANSALGTAQEGVAGLIDSNASMLSKGFNVLKKFSPLYYGYKLLKR